jgi:multiple sugar transport system substrate-binding protein
MEQSGISRRSFLGGTAASLGAFALAGCATQGAKQGSGGKATEASTIRFYGNSLGEPAQSAGWKAFVSGWEKESRAHVKPVTYPYDQASQQLALLGGKFQGVAQAGPWQVLVPSGVLADLADLAAEVGLPRSALDSYTVDGKVYAIPLTASGIGLVADGEIVTSAGLDAELSTEEFAAGLERIKKQDKDLIPYAGVTKNPDLKDAAHWMWGWGSEVVTADLDCTIGDSASVAAITWYKGLQDQGLIKAGVTRADARILFAQGKTAMYDDAPLAATFVPTNGGSRQLADRMIALARPSYSGKPAYNRSWSNGLCASAGDGELTNRSFIKYAVTNVAAATALYEKASVLPSLSSVAERIPGLKANHFQSLFRTRIAAHVRGPAWDRLAVTQQVDTTIGEGVARILVGQTSVQAGLNALRKNVQALVDQK